jgi:peptidoglycan hydrolase-like protein with peptidoglycan-binding domain
MLYPGASWKPVVNHGGTMGQVLGLVLHVQQGDGSLYGYFDNPAVELSSHWWVSKDGAVEQYVDANEIAWAQAAGNEQYHSVETEGYDYEDLTMAQIEALAELYKWGTKGYSWAMVLSNAPGKRGFAWHGMGGVAWGNHPGCPGTLRMARRQEILNLAAGGSEPSPPTPIPTPEPAAPPFPGRLLELIYPTYMSGSDVMEWQNRMRVRGWSLAADGVYGPITQGVCISFQQEKGLEVDGIVGPITWGAAWTMPITP